MWQHYKKKSADSSLSGVTAPVTPCSLASAASSPATGAELNRPHPSAVPAPVLTETKWRQVPRGTSWEATALWGRETKETEDDRRGRGSPPLLRPFLYSLHFHLDESTPASSPPCSWESRGLYLHPTDSSHTAPCCTPITHPQQPHSPWLSLWMFVQPAVIGCRLMMNGCRLLRAWALIDGSRWEQWYRNIQCQSTSTSLLNLIFPAPLYLAFFQIRFDCW